MSMIANITIGQYYPAKSPIHDLDPRVKLIGTMVYLISLFLFKGIMPYLIATIWLAFLIHLSRVPFSYMAKSIKPIMLLLVIMGLCNLFMTRGTPLLSFWVLTVTEEGVANAIYLILRLSWLIMASSLMTYTTTPQELTSGLESLLGPLKRLKVPVHEISMMMSIALRFIPILLEEADKIVNAQVARGADFENGPLLERLRRMSAILVPLFVSAFRRADELASAMEARCYHGGEGRTKMKPLRYGEKDRLAFAALALYVGAVIVSGLFLPLHIWVL